jgi:N6-L-threonylcarbamoyladenine synthase
VLMVLVGPIVEKKARLGNPSAYNFPRAFLDKDSLDFSFSGLKTSVRNIIFKREELSEFILSDEDIAASFQDAVLEVLSSKLVLACKKEKINRVVVTGGVAANQALRQRVIIESKKNSLHCFFPKPLYCTDNAAMIACAGYFNSCNKFPIVNDSLKLDAKSVMNL